MNKLTLWIIIAASILIVGFAVFKLGYKNVPAQEPQPPAPETQTPATMTAPPLKPLVPQTYNVNITPYKFVPETLTINAGDTVVWTNDDLNTHTVSSDSGYELNSGRFSQGAEYLHQFNTTGTYPYHCNIYPIMKGTIIVQ